MDQTDMCTNMGLCIEQLRTATNMTQGQLACSIDLSRSYLVEVETGKRNIFTVNLERICEGLGVTLKEFFSDELFA